MSYIERWLAGGGASESPPVSETGNTRETGGAPPDNLTSARDARGRFPKGRSGNSARRFKPGQSGNPAGRPRGSGRFRGGARVAAMLLDNEAERLARTAIEMALAGDPVAVRFCLGRLIGARRGQPMILDAPEDFPPVAAPADFTAAVTAVTAALAEGRITPAEALSLSQMLDGFPRVLAAAPQPMQSGEAVLDELQMRFQRIADSLKAGDDDLGAPDSAPVSPAPVSPAATPQPPAAPGPA